MTSILGNNDEYVVSGSDDGNFFIWDRKTARLVNILEGDGEVVNVVQGHPYETMLAVSGIDDTIKVSSAFSALLARPNFLSRYSPPMLALEKQLDLGRDSIAIHLPLYPCVSDSELLGGEHKHSLMKKASLLWRRRSIRLIDPTQMIMSRQRV